MKLDASQHGRWATGLFVALATCVVATPSRAAEPLWRQIMPRKKVEADANGDYTLTEKNGPWLIMATSFTGEAGEEEARGLVIELRQRFNLPAYYYAMTFKIGDERIGRGIDDYGAPIRRRYNRGTQVLEYAVLVGDFPTLNDPDAQNLLERVKTIEPDVLNVKEPGDTTQSLAWSRKLYRSMRQQMGKTQANGPMAHAFISRNPLLPRDYFTPGLDPEVAKWNAGPHSLLKCPGKFSIRVATFKGRSTFLGAQNGVEEEGSRLRLAKDNDPLVVAGDNAEKLALALREKGWEAYSFHDRNESYVTVGSFNEMQDLGDGRYAPATREAQIITQVFGAATPNVGFEKPAYQELGLDSNDIAKAERDQAAILAQFTAEMSKGLGQAAAGFHPKQFVGLPFDIQPQPILAPKESIGAVYAQ